MTEEAPANPALRKLVGRVRETQVFLRMAAFELRRMAERAPEVSIELRHVAQQLEAEEADLARRHTD